MHGFNRTMGRTGDALRAETAIDDAMVIDVEVVDDRRLVENLRHALRRQTEGARMAVAKMVWRNEYEIVCPQSKVEIHPHAHTPVKEARAGAKDREGRQRRPAAIIAAGTPSHP